MPPKKITLGQHIPEKDFKTFRSISAKGENQKKYIKKIFENDIIFVMGPAGCGKTLIAVAIGIQLVLKGEYDKLLISRPVLEAGGERLGFLPGDVEKKLDPYLRPIYDAVDDTILDAREARVFKEEKIEICALAHMRGRTFKNKFVVVDEAQNATYQQIDMAWTRLGEGSKMIITGSLDQSDLPVFLQGGLLEIANMLKEVEGFCSIHLGGADVARHPTVQRGLIAKEESQRPRSVKEFFRNQNKLNGREILNYENRVD